MSLLSIVSWVIVFFLGFAFLQVLCHGLKPLLKVGFSMPTGMALSSIYMFIIDLFGIPVNNIPVLIGGELLIGISFFVWSFRTHKPAFQPGSLIQGLENPGWNITYYLALFAILAILIVISVKAVLWPVVNYDSVAGYDLLGKIIAAEGTLDNTVYDKVNSLESTRTGYPPLYPYNLAFARITGAINPKVTCIFYFVSIAIAFYTLLREYLAPLGSALFTLLLVSTPDFADFSSLSSNNPPLTFYCGLGFICIYMWYDKGNDEYLRLGTVLQMFGLWDRMEAIFFVLGGALLVLLKSHREKTYRKLFYYLGVSLLPFIVWQIYMRLVLEGVTRVDILFYLFWDPEKIRVLLDQVRQTTFSSLYWGIAINLCLILIVANLVLLLVKRKKDHLILFAGIGLAWVTYILLFYQMKVDLDSVGWILYSYKRGLYTYLPPLIFGVAILYISRFFFGLESSWVTPSAVNHKN